MSKISQLAQRIRSLPEIDVELSRLTLVQRVNQDAKDITSRVSIVLSQSPYIDHLTSGEMQEATSGTISFSVTQAKSLKKLIQREKIGSEKKISGYLENLKKKTKALETLRDREWEKVQLEINSVQIILDIAETLSLDSVETLRAAVSAFKTVTASPPSNKDETKRIVMALEQNKTVMANSGLAGNVAKILQGAIAGEGDPRLLFEEDVQQFLKDHPALWGSIKLKLA